MSTEPQQKIVVEVPSTSGNFSLVPSPPPESRIENFRMGWRNAIALPDNLEDLIFDITSWVVVPAMLTSCWVSLPLPSFIQSGVMVVLILSGAIACYLYQAIPEIKLILLMRLGLISLGVVLGL